MKRLHIHMSVKDLDINKVYYTALFGQEPTKVKEDYIQWLVDDPAINFAISTNKEEIGINHLGIQVDSDEALEIIEKRLEAVNITGQKQEDAQCCYASSKKLWSLDPQNTIWETYHTMDQIETFGGDSFTGGTGCCTPKVSESGMWATGKECC